VTYTPAIRRRRRRRTILIISIVGIVSAVAYGVTRAQGEAEVTRAYLDVIYEVATGQASAAVSFSEMITEIESFTRPRMLQTLEDLEGRSDELVTLLASANPPEDLDRADLWLQMATTSWRNGLSHARAGLIALASDPVDTDGTGATSLARGVVDLRVGDRAYQGFMSEVADVDTTLLGGAFPTVTFVPAESDPLFEPVSLARRMFLTPGLTEVDDLAVADYRLDPAAVGESEGIPEVPIAASQSIEATIYNRGNTDRVEVVVSLQLVSSDGEEYTASIEIDSIAGGAARTVLFSELPVKPDTFYQVLISIPPGDDVDENDSVTFRFAVNEAS
jgi:hypothetical protein